MPTKVFFIEPTDRERQWLRRYSYPRRCSAKPDTGCHAMFELGEGDVLYTPDGYIDATKRKPKPPKDDPRWPMACQDCGMPFEPADEFQLFTRQIYVRPDTGFRCTTEEAPIGACWDAWWISERRKDGPTGCGYMIGDDHRSLVVRCPDGHDWHVDARASNCTMKEENTHHCWVRHGQPEDGTLHVDKAGHTCAAGAGSIDTGKWHGFLHGGELTP